MAVWYCGSTKWTAVAQWTALATYGAGSIVRQIDGVTVGNERCFRTALGGVADAAQPTWVLTKGAAQPADGTITDWTEITGNSTYNAPNNFAAPHARLRNTLAWMAAGDTCYVSNHHAATEAAALTLTSPGTPATPCYILCIDDTQATATLATGASETNTGDSALSFGSAFDYYYGIQFSAGTGSGSAARVNFSPNVERGQVFDSCRFVMPSSGNSTFTMSLNSSTNDDQLVVFNNTTVKFGSVSQTLGVRLRFVWANTPSAIDATGAIPTILFTNQSSQPGLVNLRGVDLSALGSGKTLVSVAGAAPSRYLFENCKLGANVALTTGAIPGPGGAIIEFVRCASGATNIDYYFQNYQGTITQEPTIVRTGGASDGSTPISRKMVSSAGSNFVSPLVLDCIAVWNETTGSALTATVYVASTTQLYDDGGWLEIEHLGTLNFPLSLFASDRMANRLSTRAVQATSTEAWDGATVPARANSTAYTLGQAIKVASNPGRLFICTTAGTTAGSEPGDYATAVDGTAVADNTAVFTAAYRQKFHVAFTPQMKGPIKVRVMLTAVSAAPQTMYACPKVTVA